MKAYKLKIQLGKFPAGSVVVDDGDSYHIGSSHFDIRGSVAEGEFAMLISQAINNHYTSIIEEMES